MTVTRAKRLNGEDLTPESKGVSGLTLISICVGLQVYLAQRAWPDYTTFKDPDRRSLTAALASKTDTIPPSCGP